RPHQKFHRAGYYDHCLTLTVDVPLWRGLLLVFREQLLDAVEALLPLLLVLGPLVVDLLQPRLLLPRPEQPFRRRMQTWIGRHLIHLLHLRHHGLARLWR